jgi:xylan 1,4-beta-xylosidase
LAIDNASAVGVKAVHASLQVGGPATQHLNTQNFLSQAKAMGAPVDFVSSHNYPTGPRGDGSGCPQHDDWQPDCFRDRVMSAVGKIPATIPFALTEYSVMVGHGMAANTGEDLPQRSGEPPYQHDDAGAAAFVFRVVPELAPHLEVMSYWSFSDIFEEDSIPDNEFRKMPYGDAGDSQPHYGAMSLHGVPKPVWRAFQLLHAHAGTHLINTTAVTHGTSTPLPTLISAHTTVNATTTASGSDHEVLAVERGSGRLFLSHWAAAAGSSSELWMIDGSTEAKTLWLSMGQPAVPSASQLLALKAHSQLKPAELSWSQQGGSSGVWTAVVSMPPNSACVVTL